MGEWTRGFGEIDGGHGAAVGGKGASLGELARIGGVRVPPGFCVTTGAYRRVVEGSPALDGPLGRLAESDPDDREAIGALSAEVRRTIEGIAIPVDVAEEITGALRDLGAGARCAVRSSATAEDLPTASFAGQHESYLDVTGPEAVLRHVSRCWASLFTERAVTYRLRNGFGDRAVRMAVVVQRMIAPHASGVLFTADPVSGNRRVAAIEACSGLGEGLVSGRVNADAFAVRDGAVISRTVVAEPVLSDVQAVGLAALGRRVEAHFGAPQDIEWCLDDAGFHIVQSRPITTLFPIPERDDDEPHVYVSVGHQQMMTDAMTPLGHSLFQLTALVPMFDAAGRLFVDVTRALGSPAGVAGLFGMLGRSDPLVADALQTIIDRDFVARLPDGDAGAAPPRWAAPRPIDADPAIVEALTERIRASNAALEDALRAVSGAEALDVILADMPEHKRVLSDPESIAVIMAGMQAAWWLDDTLAEWLGEADAADVLSQSVPGNVTSEMGLALLDVADAIRPHPQVVAFLERAGDDDLLQGLDGLEGGPEARAAIEGFLDVHGVRCVGEIDVTRPRWRERPATLVPAILGNVRNFAPGEGARRFARGARAAEEKTQEVLARLRELPDGEAKAEEAARMIDRLRTFAGYREFPKYGIATRFAAYRWALVAEADRLVEAGVLGERDDAFLLTFPELHEAVRTGRVEGGLVEARREAFRGWQALTPPRVLTSEGEAVSGVHRRDDLPAGALAGLAVSAGTVEGRARVVLDVARADLDPGDILVTAFTDPSWTPVFPAARGLVTEVGGVMSHGSVIAREYGLPAVVGVQDATRLIRDGQRIRVHGSDGYVEILA